jgi:hypothetical protein
MTQQTATEKDMFLQSFERETAITLKLLRAFPADRCCRRASAALSARARVDLHHRAGHGR